MKVNYKKQGKRNLASGRRFELRVRKDLEEKGWVCSKWQNNVDLEKGKLISAKQGIFHKTSTGFPDFVIYRELIAKAHNPYQEELIKYDINGVEAKSNGYLTQEEKKKCRWLLKNRIFNKIIIAKKGKKRGKIKYEEFK